jgi:hypothetical protein
LPDYINDLLSGHFLHGNDENPNIANACAAGWHFIVHDPERIQSIGKSDWATVSQQRGWYQM